MNLENILLVFQTNYARKPNNPNQFASNQVKVKITIVTTHFHHHQYNTQNIRLYIELKKQTPKVWSYLLKT